MVGTAGADTLNVNDTGWWKDGNSFNESSTPIQAAVSNASSGDTILVDSGTYIENIEVSTSLLNITSANGASVTHVIAADPENPVFDIKSDSVTINGFNISGANGNNGIYASGIYLNNANYCNLTDNTIPDNYFSAIYLSSSSNNNITGNTIANNSMIYGIYLASSENNNLSNNIVFGNNYGIYLANSNNNNLTGNDVSENPGIGIYLQSSSNDNKLIDNIIQDNEGHGILMDDCDNNNITANNISDNGYFDGDEFSGIYLLNSITNNITANTISGNGYHGIKLEGSNSNNLIDNTISGNGYFDVTAYSGIYLLNSITNNITANTISDNDGNGIYMSSPKDTSSDNNFSSNTVYNNSNGIYLQYPQDSTLTDNTVYNNSNGIYLQYPQDSILTGNTVFNNTENGITLYDVDRVYNENNTLIDNTVLNNNNGIDISYVYNTTLIDNIALDNNNGIKIAHSKYNNLTQNNVSNNINNGVYFVSSHENRLVNNTILNNKIGLLLGGQYGSSNNFVGNNNISNNGDNEINSDQGYGCGIYIHESGKNELSGNILSNNDRYGIFLYPGYNNSIYNNTISMNGGGGIYLSGGSSENHIYNNYFNNDIRNAYISGTLTNYWNTTKTLGPNIAGGDYIGGNLWATPDGTGFSQENTDTDGDGFCDTPNDTYTIHEAENNYDYLPLVMPTSLKFTESPAVFFINNDGTNRSENANFTFAYSGENISLWTKLDNKSDASVVADFSNITGNTNPISFEHQGDGVFTLLNHTMPDNDTGVYYISIHATTATGANNTVCPVMLNFNPQSNITGLGNPNTTDWTTIEDLTNVSNLTFEANDSNGDVIGSLEFTEYVNLCDIEFAQKLQQFGEYVDFDTAQTTLDSANLSRLNNSTSLTMYGLGSFENQPGILLDGQPILEAGNTSSDSVSGLDWNAEKGTLTFSVDHWSTYTADGKTPEVTAISPKEKRVKVGDTLEMNVSVKDTSGISSVVVNVSSINDTVDEAVLKNVSGYWVNNSIMVDTDAEDTYYLNVNATDVLGNYNNTVNLSVIRADTLKADDYKKSSSGGRSSVGPSMPPEDVEGTVSGIKRVLAGSNVKYDFSDGQGPVLGISFDAKDDKGTVVAKVQALKDKPDDVDDPKGNSYQLMSITVGSEGTISDENADNILIEFKVSKEWVEENNIDPSTIRMTRFHDGKWQDLPSNQVREDDQYLHFTAETPGFSVFSIVGDEYKEGIEEPIAEQPEDEETTDEPASETENAQTPGFTAIFAVALIAGAALIMRKD
ncbi:PGF-pre-PGF domain-containing protein [Methanohalophilus euhalobius]|uniref:PGF-pre-PGF domain-containing protein n=1 Tax=Methanohalophilus euhalobius TaxID=51203 RepID=A0A285G5R7_9EURY|nr:MULTISPECIES: NosD domain-containing protein [Methanohalophilus]ODV49737.1 MAG: PKD domain containing protein [Methanohalophilus sp. 2-GBenrich]RXG34512.1 PKD domain containing protein [Methanohalophilus sp. WG1-DM]TCL12045.1 PGF-pre-PGF domain-containing protein [Methanohalophilus euhalobius]SNY18454.1 PGF-pre-PGF domain-containing protein [Methanohalophilus euhalobius]